MFYKSPVSFGFYQPLTQTWQIGRDCRVAISVVAPFIALATPVNREVGQSNWRRRPRQYARVFVVITPESVRFLGRRVYPGFVMALLSAMQSGVTDSLINELRLSLGVARRTLQRWRHGWREIFVETPFWNFSSGRYMPPIEHAALPNTLLERFSGIDSWSQLVLYLQFLAPLSRSSFITHDDGR